MNNYFGALVFCEELELFTFISNLIKPVILRALPIIVDAAKIMA